MEADPKKVVAVDPARSEPGPAAAPGSVFRYADPERNTIEIVETGGVFPVAEAATYRCAVDAVLPYDEGAAKNRRRQQALAALDKLDKGSLRAVRAVLTALAAGTPPAEADLGALRQAEETVVATRGHL